MQTSETIVITKNKEGKFDYEIKFQDPAMLLWHTFHQDYDFESEEVAKESAEEYLDNWEPKTVH